MLQEVRVNFIINYGRLLQFSLVMFIQYDTMAAFLKMNAKKIETWSESSLSIICYKVSIC